MIILIVVSERKRETRRKRHPSCQERLVAAFELGSLAVILSTGFLEALPPLYRALVRVLHFFYQ
jgi:hypothetical protein